MYLFKFIIYYFVHIAKLNNIVFLHCCNGECKFFLNIMFKYTSISIYFSLVLLQLAQLTQNAILYTQFWHLDKVNLEVDQLHDQLLNHQLTKLGIYLDINCNGSSTILDMVSKG